MTETAATRPLRFGRCSGAARGVCSVTSAIVKPARGRVLSRRVSRLPRHDLPSNFLRICRSHTQGRRDRDEYKGSVNEVSELDAATHRNSSSLARHTAKYKVLAYN